MIRRIVIGAVVCLAGAGMAYTLSTAVAADAPKKIDFAKLTPPQVIAMVPKGKLKNPYNDKEKNIVKEGQHIFLSYSCNGCHGGGGGGGMCPPLINDVWVYEGDDDTLFRLVTLGSVALQKEGYRRKGSENVVGPMPPYGAIIKNGDELWKIITFLRSKYDGPDMSYKYGTPPDQR